MNLDIWKVLLDDPRWADKTDEFAPSKFNPSRSVAVCLYWVFVSWQWQNMSVNCSAVHGVCPLGGCGNSVDLYLI